MHYFAVVPFSAENFGKSFDVGKFDSTQICAQDSATYNWTVLGAMVY
jgi:hypothetical protein